MAKAADRRVPRYQKWYINDYHNLNNLKKHSLFQHCLLDDILRGNVFPAIRSHKIDFYLRGRKLCSFNGKTFQANVSYLAAFQNRPNGEITEDQFAQLRVCGSFEDGYEQIKKNIVLFEQPESGGVFQLCRRHSFYKTDFVGPIGVLDIEVSLEAEDEERSQDRMDLVLYHKERRQLRFFEAKTFDNTEIWPTKGDALVVQQILRYTDQLKQRNDELLAGYGRYVKIMNHLCGTKLSHPLSIDTDVDLLLFGFDTLQLRTIQNVLLPAYGDSFRSCLIGKPRRARPETLATWWNNRE